MTTDPKKLRKEFENEFYKYDYIQTYRSYVSFGKEYRYDFCILTEKKTGKKIIRLQKRWWGITKKMIADGKKRSKWVIIGTYNLNSQKDFPPLYKILEKFKAGKVEEIKDVISKIDFNTQIKQITALNSELRKVARKPRKSKADRELLKRKQDKIKELNEKLLEVNEENRVLRIQNFKINLDSYKKILKQLTTALTTKAKQESYFQKELTKNKWIFGPWFEDVIPKRKADPENQPDFILKRFDGFADVVEIETPGKELFTKPNRSNKSQPRAELIQALTQIIDYIDSYNDKYKDELYKDFNQGIDNPLNPYKPRGLLIIGRYKKLESKKLRQLNSFLNNISIITYDEFLINAQSMLEFIEKRK